MCVVAVTSGGSWHRWAASVSYRVCKLFYPPGLRAGYLCRYRFDSDIVSHRVRLRTYLRRMLAIGTMLDFDAYSGMKGPVLVFVCGRVWLFLQFCSPERKETLFTPFIFDRVKRSLSMIVGWYGGWQCWPNSSLFPCGLNSGIYISGTYVWRLASRTGDQLHAIP